ncbi:MAG: transcription antitermination factor NusB [Planctomycetota bacterium]|nr:transcription antitermination factor NusB [Planctomycetota bacterium]
MKTGKHTGSLMRSRAREAALQYLYQLDFDFAVLFSFDDFLDELYELVLQDDTAPHGTKFLPLSSNAREFSQKLVTGVREQQEKIDEIISENAENWSINRMAPVDRNVIRMATFEMLKCDDIPNRVAINEAINLAKKFGGDKSGAFVNSVLDKIRGDLEGDGNDD